jgi:hypothetical protein
LYEARALTVAALVDAAADLDVLILAGSPEARQVVLAIKAFGVRVTIALR